MHGQIPYVAAERIRLLYRQTPQVLAANILNSALIVFGLWNPAVAPRLLGWAGALALVTTLRAGLWGWYLRRRPADGEMATWGLRYAVSSAVSGLIWGVTAPLFIEPGAPLTVLLIAFVIGGMAAGAVTALSSHLPAFYAYLLASVLPLAGQLVVLGDRVSLSMAALTLVFTAGLAIIGRNFNAMLTGRLQLAEDMQRLAEDLERQVRDRTEAVRAVNDQLNAILSTTDDHVFMICWSGALIYASPSALRDFDIDGAMIAGKSWTDLGLSPKEAEKLEGLHRRVMETGLGVTEEITHATPDSPRCYEYKFNPMIGSDGRIGAVIAVSRDITEHMRTKHALERARAAAENADQGKSRFLAAASHDLRQPMQSMFLFAGALRQRITDAQGQEMLTMLESGLDTLKGLLDSLLDVSQLDVNVIQPRTTTIAIHPFIKQIVAAYQPIAASRGLSLRIDQEHDIQVLSDPTLLGRMVRNLVENAIRYTERGRIVVSSRADGDSALIEVSDTGIGIAPDQLERIFEEFHQINNPERDKAQGIGLGLAIVQRLSSILKHPVEVRSLPGQGSVFSIRVPLDSMPAAPPSADTKVDAPRKDKLVALVDDDAIVLLSLRAMLESYGYQTTIAGSAEQALERLAGGGRIPDLVIADYRLRGGAVGTEAILAIRARIGQPVPGIILTGETSPECARDAAAHGFSIIHKPVTPRQLAASLERLTGTGPAAGSTGQSENTPT